MLSFFQAEDGIRDIGVTGVQTCALPIYELGVPPVACEPGDHDRVGAARRVLALVRGDAGVRDRKSVVQGKSVDLGGRRIIKKKRAELSRLTVAQRDRNQLLTVAVLWDPA